MTINVVAGEEYLIQVGGWNGTVGMGDLTIEQADEFIGMYVNDRTLDYGDDGRESVRLFLQRAADMGVISAMPPLDFVR